MSIVCEIVGCGYSQNHLYSGTYVGVFYRSLCSAHMNQLRRRGAIVSLMPSPKVKVIKLRKARTVYAELHGHGKNDGSDKTYNSWKAMKQRCSNPNNKNYNLYGGRGITYCDSWKSFVNFLKDMGDRPENTTLDRIDPDGDYEPSNCRWADSKVQALNKRKK